MTAQDTALTLAIAPHARGHATLGERLLNVVLFITVLTSAIAFIEPSPHDVLMFVLLVACIAARVKIDRKLAPLIVLTVVWLVGGGLSLIQVGDDTKAIQYFGTSVYLGVAGIMFACLFCEGDMTRLAILRRGYVLAALAATAAGYVGFFHLFPGSDAFLALSDDGLSARVTATFKDPNVYGPFLVFPLLMLMIQILTVRLKLSSLAAMAFLLGGLLLSFSRGAWIHFALSAIVAAALLYSSTTSRQMRLRMAAIGLIAIIVTALILVALISIPSIHEMLLERAKALQPYDTGPGGRFTLQQLALTAILDHPNGMGPFEFANVYGGQQHDVYMEGLLVYGWLGGAAYLTLVLVTLLIGLRSVRLPSPWQAYLIAAYGAFVGEALEGFIIDTDHWRHFFLLLGLVWGLSVATINRYRQRAWQQAQSET